MENNDNDQRSLLVKDNPTKTLTTSDGLLVEALCTFKQYMDARQAKNLTPTAPGELKSYVDSVACYYEKNKQALPVETPAVEDPFLCQACHCLWKDPLTVSCGHTFCRSCVDSQPLKKCQQCRKKREEWQYRTNVLLQHISEKWFPGELAAAALRKKGNECFHNENFSQALHYYTEALNFGKSHLVPGITRD